VRISFSFLPFPTLSVTDVVFQVNTLFLHSTSSPSGDSSCLLVNLRIWEFDATSTQLVLVGSFSFSPLVFHF
jgi:hypothetical protein